MKNKLLIFALVTISLMGCKDYLDLVPEKDLTTIESIFEKRNTALKFQSGIYQAQAFSVGDIQYDPAMSASDEYVIGDYARNKSFSDFEEGTYLASLKIAEGLQNPNTPILNIWGKRPAWYKSRFSNRYESIRYCNICINHVDDVYNMTEQEKLAYKAEAYAMKAYYYFELVKHYGPIVLVPENLSVLLDIESMQMPRSHVDTCFARIVKLFDEAIPHLPTIYETKKIFHGSMTKEAAYALKAKALLYAASPLFNGNSWFGSLKNKDGETLFSTDYDENKWKLAAEAIDDAIEFAEEIGKELVSGSNDNSNEKVNTIRDIQASTTPETFIQKEVIYGVWPGNGNKKAYKLKLPRYNPNNKYKFGDAIKGNLTPSMRMVELYYTENGLPIDMDKTWNNGDRYKMGVETNPEYSGIVKLNENVLNLHLKREPRFYASIAADKCYWKRSWENVDMKPYKGQDHGTDKNRVVPSAPQNLSGYWIKKMVPSGVYGGEYPYIYIELVYPIVRLADLYLMQAEAWNEVEGPSQKVYDAIDKIRDRAGIPSLEEAWNTFSSSPNKIKNKEGLREVIHQERMIELAFEGHRFWDTRRWKTAHTLMNSSIKGWNVFGENSRSFYNDYEGPIVVWDRNKFQSPRDYFWPIKDEEVLISGVKQNLGW